MYYGKGVSPCPTGENDSWYMWENDVWVPIDDFELNAVMKII